MTSYVSMYDRFKPILDKYPWPLNHFIYVYKNLVYDGGGFFNLLTVLLYGAQLVMFVILIVHVIKMIRKMIDRRK
jgi:hypothetical protein